MSRGIEIIETVLDTGSSETTIMVSVRYVFRPTPESTPTIRPVTRGTVGLADGDAEARGDPLGSGGGVSKFSGSGSGLNDGTTAAGAGSSKTSSAVSRIVSVA